MQWGMRKILLKIEKCFPFQKSKRAAYIFFFNLRENSGNCAIETLEVQTRTQGSFRKEAPQTVALSRGVEARGHCDSLHSRGCSWWQNMGIHPARWSLSSVRPGHDWLTRKVSVPRGCARACAKGPQHLPLKQQRKKGGREEIRERKRKRKRR